MEDLCQRRVPSSLQGPSTKYCNTATLKRYLVISTPSLKDQAYHEPDLATAWVCYPDCLLVRSGKAIKDNSGAREQIESTRFSLTNPGAIYL